MAQDQRPAMANQTRREPSRHSTTTHIITVAERLWGESGLNAVSLRQISLEAGLANPASVQYHFGDRDGLVRAIYQYRLPILDQRRSELIAGARQAAKIHDVRVLLDCLFRPLYEQTDERGRHTYASFLRQVLQSTPARSLRAQSMNLTPATDEILSLITRAVPDVPEVLMMRRVLSANFLMLDQLFGFDRDLTESLPRICEPELLYEDSLDILAAGFRQPAAPELLTSLMSRDLR